MPLEPEIEGVIVFAPINTVAEPALQDSLITKEINPFTGRVAPFAMDIFESVGITVSGVLYDTVVATAVAVPIPFLNAPAGIFNV